VSNIRAGGNFIGCPSLIGNTAGVSSGPVPGAKGFFYASFFEPQFFNSMFWNRRSTPVPPSGLGFYSQEFFEGQFWNSFFWNRRG
jgi:hypothetical protein